MRSEPGSGRPSNGHTGFAAAGKTYRDEVLADTSTFRLMTVEEILKPEVLHRPETASAFKERYQC
ncbi:MAG: hypothetical protein ACSLEW_03725 [Nocardioides sp.]